MPTTYNIFQLADENVNHLQKLFTRLKDKVNDETLSQVTKFIDENLVFSINFDQNGLEQFLETCNYKNAYELYDSQAEAEKHFSKRSEQRLAFDNTFENGQKFKYAALNLGTIGVPAYWGQFCLHFDLKKYESEHSVAFIKNNSLQKDEKGKFIYFENDNCTFNAGKFLIDLATTENKHQLICLKLATKNLEADGIRQTICRSDGSDYMELIFINGDLSAYLKGAYIWRRTNKVTNKNIFNNKLSNQIEKQEKEFGKIHELLKQQGLRLITKD